MMSGGRLNAVTSAAAGDDDFQFAPMQQQPPPPPYLGFDHGVGVAGGGMGQRSGGGMHPHLYDGLDFAALQFQEASHHQLLTLPSSSSLAPTAPLPMPLHMPVPMHGDNVYPAELGMVKREGGAGLGLNLGRRTYFSPGDMLAVDRLLMRSSRLGGVFGLGGFGVANHQQPPPRCQAEGCKADLSGAKHYHRRHKVCEYHAKASVVTAGGKQQRFCQQCSRFHVLTEFDEAKRSCRKRLAEHNRRRRKPATTAVPSKDGSKKPNAVDITSSYTTDNKNLSTTMSSNTSSVISCLDDQGKHQQARATLTLGAMTSQQDKQDGHDQQEQQLSAMLQFQSAAGHHHQEQHLITSLQVQSNHNYGNDSYHRHHRNNVLACSSMCSTALPSANNGELSDQTNNSNNNMHLFEVDYFMS